MRRKALSAAAVLLAMVLVLSGCGDININIGSDSGSSLPLPSLPGGADEQEESAGLECQTDFIRAELKNGELTVTFLSEDKEKYYLPDGDYYGFAYDTPHPVTGADSKYTDMYIGIMGQDYCPYLFLLREDGQVEYVPIYEQLFVEEGDAQMFSCKGLLDDVSDIVSFEQRNIPFDEDEGSGGYVTVIATDSSGKEYDLSNACYFTENPKEKPPSADEAMALVSELQIVVDRLSGGLSMVCGGETQYIYLGGIGETCTVVELGKGSGSSFAGKYKYAASGTGAVYYYDADMGWTAANTTAELYSGAGYDDLFVMVTDENTTEYMNYLNAGERISTPAVGLDAVSDVMLMCLANNTHFRIELLGAYDEATDTFSNVEVYKEFDADRGDVFYISTDLAEALPPLRIVATSNESFYPMEAVWYALYDGSGENPIQYASGEYIEEAQG